MTPDCNRKVRKSFFKNVRNAADSQLNMTDQTCIFVLAFSQHSTKKIVKE